MNGLTTREAALRLHQHGFNELPSATKRGVGRILLRVLQEPMLLLLVSCGAIYSVSGEFRDGILLFGSAILVVAITLYQEVKSERALDALRSLASPRALVIRDGMTRRIPGREVVPGDLLQVFEGDRVPADARLVSASHLSVDESLLTGESFSVSKVPQSQGAAGDRLFSGSMVVAGQGFAVVEATGPSTELGKIGKSIGEAREQPTELQRELNRMVRAFGVVGVAFSLGIAITYGLTRGDWTKGILAGLAAAMSLLPEEFPVVMTVFLAMGAWRISRRSVLTRRMSAIEALGSVSALCVDKTGTLTQNRMAVRDAIGEDPTRLQRVAALACSPSPVDPMEKAILEAGRKVAPEADSTLRLEKQYPLSSDLLAMTMAWKSAEDGTYLAACKGAPEAVIRLCRLDPAREARVLETVRQLASGGRRVLAVAQGSPTQPLPEKQEALELTLLGLLGLEDPIRPDVPAAIAECAGAGIRVLMLTGDYPETARSIARQLGLEESALSGAEIAGMDDLKLKQAVVDYSVYARVSPEQKLRIVMALKSHGERVAMTGDGVNDAPSLKWADIGVAMGERGTDVAREAAAIVLLDDSFSSLVAAIRLGRRIYDNIRKAVLFIFAIHIPIAGLAILPVIFKLPLLLLPAHIVFLELIIDPACSLVYEAEAEEPGVMRRPPRPKDASIFGLADLGRTAIQGLGVLILVFSLYLGSLWQGRSAEQARTLAFLSLVLCNLALILVNRRPGTAPSRLLRERNRAFDFVGAGALALLIAVISLPALREVFSFSPLGLSELALATATGLISLAISGAVGQLGLRERLGERADKVGLGQDPDKPLS